MIKINNLTFSYADVPILQSLSFSIEKGEIFGILGPNGSGKTTLLKLLSRSLHSSHGEISMNDNDIQSFSNKEYAKQVAVLPQHVDTTFSYSVKETVLMGRYAHQTGLFQTWSTEDEQIVQNSLKDTTLLHLQNKNIQELSGGERQRVFLARALAQKPKLLLLDEPTNHLDVSNQISLFDSLSTWKREHDLTIVAIFHDLNLASLYCDRILLLHEGRQVSLGKPKEMMEEEILGKVYNTAIVRKEHPEVAKPFIGLVPNIAHDSNDSILNNVQVIQDEDHIIVTTNSDFKTLSSSLVGGGYGWANTFVNRRVDHQYASNDALKEMKAYLTSHGIDSANTIGMMTAVNLNDVVMKRETLSDCSILVLVTAGTGNAIDSSRAHEHKFASATQGTINTFIFLEAHLSDSAFVQVITTATEAKTKALQSEGVVDPVTEGMATGTSTDSICIASTQTNNHYEYGGPLTTIGKLVGKVVFEATKESIQKYKIRKWGQ